MRVEVFASGSSGNCTYIETMNHKILIDVGISKKNIVDRLNQINVSFEEIDILLITHEHEDHIKSLCMILKSWYLTCYMTKGTFQAISEGKNEPLKQILQAKLTLGHIILLNRLENSIQYEPIFLPKIKIEILPTFHDAQESVGYKVIDDDQTLVYITDTGYIHQSLYETIANADCYILEFNHDPYILMSSNRTYALKMRILSDHGHLSNENAAIALSKVLGKKTKLVFYAHISQECNLIEIVESTRKKVMNDLKIDTSGIEFVATSPLPTKIYIL